MSYQEFSTYFDGLTKDDIAFAFMSDGGVKGGFVAGCDRKGLIQYIKHCFDKHGCWFAAMEANTRLLPVTTVLFGGSEGGSEGGMETPSIWADTLANLQKDWLLSCDI